MKDTLKTIANNISNIENELEEIKTKLSLLEKEESTSKISKEDEMEILFLLLMNDDLTLKIDFDKKLKNWYNNKGEWVIGEDDKYYTIWFSYIRFWSVFERKFHINSEEIKNFLENMVEKHLNLNGYTSICFEGTPGFSWKEHLNSKEYIPYNKIVW